MALTDIGISPWPVMKMIGISIPRIGQLLLKFQPVDAGQPHVERRGNTVLAELRSQKRLSALEGLRPPAFRLSAVPGSRRAHLRHRPR